MDETTHLHMKRPAFVLMAQRDRAWRRALWCLALAIALTVAQLATGPGTVDNALFAAHILATIATFAFVWRSEYLRRELKRRGY